MPPNTPVHHSPAAQRNREPIAQHLLPYLGAAGRALEIASGSGQHIAYLAAATPQWHWQPSDWQSDAFASIALHCQEAGASNAAPAVLLDVACAPWQGEAITAAPWDMVYCSNMLHIAPWACCAGLMQGAAQHLAPEGILVTYGPYLERDTPTADSNRQFDAQLRQQNPAWGLRHLDDVAAQAQRAGLHLMARHALPANNLLLVWTRNPSGTGSTHHSPRTTPP